MKEYRLILYIICKLDIRSDGSIVLFRNTFKRDDYSYLVVEMDGDNNKLWYYKDKAEIV